jgi:hypothetical protein
VAPIWTNVRAKQIWSERGVEESQKNYEELLDDIASEHFQGEITRLNN